MTRAERRRRERLAAKAADGLQPRPAEIDVALHATGQHDSGLNLDGMPAKKPGTHRWIAVVGYSVTEAQLDAATAGDTYLDHENRVFVQLGCHDCHMAYSDQMRRTVCTAQCAV